MPEAIVPGASQSAGSNAGLVTFVLYTIGVFALAIIVVFTLFFMRKVSTTVFWIVVIICAVAGYLVLPRLRAYIEKN